MSAPTFLTQMSDGEAALVVGIPMILGLHFAATRFINAEDDVAKGKIMIATGLAIMAAVSAASYTCEDSKRGACAVFPKYSKLFDFAP